ncbi:unnamed protein product [Trichobilharzia regenti]|nr:unnamed protein product [Trichobilharzia regenti]
MLSASVEKEDGNESSGLEEYEKEEITRQNDLKERDAFVKRLVDRDQQETKRLSSKPASKHEEALKKIAAGEVSREEMVAELRKASRRAYLKKRQSDKLADLQAEIKDEELFFDDEEYAPILCFLYLLGLLRRKRLNREVKEPESKVNDEGKRWEQEHLSSALFSFGAKDKTERQNDFDL